MNIYHRRVLISCVGPRSWAAIGEAKIYVNAWSQEACGSQMKQINDRAQLSCCYKKRKWNHNMKECCLLKVIKSIAYLLMSEMNVRST